MARSNYKGTGTCQPPSHREGWRKLSDGEAVFKLLFGALGFYQRVLGPSQWARGEPVDWTLIRPIQFHEYVLACGGKKVEGEHRPEFELQLSYFLGVRLWTNHLLRYLLTLLCSPLSGVMESQ